MNIATLYAAQCTLGESPLWHNGRTSCFWADIHSGVLYEYNWHTRDVHRRHIAENLSLVLEGNGNDLLLAVKGGFIKMNMATGLKAWLTDVDKHLLNNRCNDGACDAEGRLWVGTMDTQCAANAGSLYRIDADNSVKEMISKVTIPNGLVWSLNNERMYFIDTPSQKVIAYVFNRQSGEILFEKIAIEIPEDMGMPDGMAIDAEGMLWVALYNGAAITRWNPENGQLLTKINLPALHITNCAFAGENLDSLIVTSARENLSREQLSEYPESGNVFVITDLPFKGVPNNVAHVSF